MAKNGEDFVVYDTKTRDDITRSVLIQIVQEQETREPPPLLPTEFLKQLIRFYGDSLRALLAFYLDFSVVTLTSQDVREKAVQAGASVGVLLDDQVRRNIAFFERIIAGFQPIPGTDDKNRPSA
jgi:polyhydroxyalkanoate synthesis repressor PhaR